MLAEGVMPVPAMPQDVALLQEVFVRADAAMLASLAARGGLKHSQVLTIAHARP